MAGLPRNSNNTPARYYSLRKTITKAVLAAFRSSFLLSFTPESAFSVELLLQFQSCTTFQPSTLEAVGIPLLLEVVFQDEIADPEVQSTSTLAKNPNLARMSVLGAPMEVPTDFMRGIISGSLLRDNLVPPPSFYAPENAPAASQSSQSHDSRTIPKIQMPQLPAGIAIRRLL
jgi:hypothetical protein